MSVIVPLLVVLLTGNILGKNTMQINEVVDHKLKISNKLAVEYGNTVNYFGTGRVKGFFSYEDGRCLGHDTMMRTGDCHIIFDRHGTTQVYRVGMAMFACFFSKMEYRGYSGSGYFTHPNNSIFFRYKVVKEEERCNVHLTDCHLSLNNAKLHISDRVWDNNDEHFDRDLLMRLLPDLNHRLKEKAEIMEEELKYKLCDHPKKYLFVDGLDVLRKALFL